MKTKRHFAFCVDVWDSAANSIVEHIAGVEDYQVALATFRAACKRWPGTPITLRQGARVVEDRPLCIRPESNRGGSRLATALPPFQGAASVITLLSDESLGPIG
jgi:hypothetical protein